MNSSWPETLRTFAFFFARPLSSEQLQKFSLSPEMAALFEGELGKDSRNNGIENYADRLAEEYTRLFVGPHTHFPPQEGLALGDRQFLGDRAMGVQMAYSASGYEATNADGLLPDHLSVELDFLAVLIEKGKRQALKKFLLDHVMAWVPDWVQAYTRQAGFKFYPAAGSVLCDFLGAIAGEISHQKIAEPPGA